MIARLQQVTELLRHEDIEELISIGAPDDEYDSEALMITDRIETAETQSAAGRVSQQQVFAIIVGVWREMFSLSDEELQLRSEAIGRIASRIVPE